jgi:Na+-translocating ferredoxin:NAD+ oxidoreductase RnfA subunit
MCDQTGVKLIDDAKSAALISTILTGVGVAAVAGGVVLYLTAPKRESTAVTVAPVFDGEAVTIAVSGGF